MGQSSWDSSPIYTDEMTLFKARVDALIDEATKEKGYSDEALLLKMGSKIFMMFNYYTLQLYRAWSRSGRSDDKYPWCLGARPGPPSCFTYRGVRIEYGEGYSLELLAVKPPVDEDFSPGESPIAQAFRKAFKE